MSSMLVGKTVTAIFVADDKMAIKFVTTEGDVIALCDADCCSHTWIEHIELPAKGFPFVVNSVSDLNMPTPEYEDPDREVVAYYGFGMSTSSGDFVLDYRNESNGYYGGSLEWIGESSYFYGGVYGQNVSSQNYVPVLEDF